MKKDAIDKLIEEQDKIENQDIKDALEQYKKEKKAENKEVILERLRMIDSELNESVTTLRKVRELEREAKSVVETINNAKEKFLSDGNWEIYKNVVSNTKRVLVQRVR